MNIQEIKMNFPEIAKIQEDFNNVLSYSQSGLSTINSDALFEQWYENKPLWRI